MERGEKLRGKRKIDGRRRPREEGGLHGKERWREKRGEGEWGSYREEEIEGIIE